MNDFEQLLAAAEQQAFSGWDFSVVANRIHEEAVTWNYRQAVLRNMKQVNSMLDMGTGGGEFLSSLAPLPGDTCATEGYLPNVDVATQRLQPLGVEVAYIESDDHIPFANRRFGLVINRHESYSASEVYRVLKPGGRFINQQVGGKNDIQLNQYLGAPPMDDPRPWTLTYAANELRQSGFTVVTEKEEFPETRFYDIGAVVFYLKVIEWQIPGFTVDAYREKLLELHRRIEADGFISVKSHRFYIEAVRE